MTIKVINSWESVLQESITAAATEMTLLTADALELGDIAAGDYYIGTLRDSVETPTKREVIHITNRSGDVITIDRGKEDTSGVIFDAGNLLRVELTAGLLESFVQGTLPDGDGDIVITDSEQTLTNKTLVDAILDPSVEEILEDRFLL